VKFEADITLSHLALHGGMQEESTCFFIQ